MPIKQIEFDAEFSAYMAARQQALSRLAYLLTGDRHMAEDLVQTALAKTYLAWSRVRRSNSVDAYVRRILVNEHTTWWRRAWRRETSVDAVPDEPGSVAWPYRDNGEGLESNHELRDAVRRLSPKLRAAVVLRYYADLTEAETAEALNCSTAAVKSRCRRAISQLREALLPIDTIHDDAGRAGEYATKEIE